MEIDNNLYAELRKWHRLPILAEQGILLACDVSLEWLLPWWWENYSRNNSYPVTFIDFGLSLEMKEWCKKHGHYIFLPVADIFVTSKEEVDRARVADWENHIGDKFWKSRDAWFKKPLACLQSPYRQTLWMDVDCEVKDSLSGVFDIAWREEGIAITIYSQDISTQKTEYNTGVMLFEYGHSLIEKWAEAVFTRNHLFIGDEDLLLDMIHEQKISIASLPKVYNSHFRKDVNPQAKIVHWQGSYGKSIIMHHMQSNEWQSLHSPFNDNNILL